MKTCANGCNQYVFSKKLCKSCWGKKYGKPLNKSKPIAPSIKPIRNQSDKQVLLNRQLTAIKKEIELDAVQDNEYFCKGCGQSYVGLDKSHILAIGEYKHLELVKENIQLLCRKCHEIWESKDYYRMVKLLCFVDNMKYVKRHDESLYWRIMNQRTNLQYFQND